MVYAVAMLTIRNFERALGRLALWSPRRVMKNGRTEETYVRKLRIYPHALREPNAYYSPAKKALLFGYFPASTSDSREHLPRGMVFTCLSHDVIAHETTHALLDGLHRRVMEPTNPDVLAFHEAFADIVAIFQHFTFPEVIRHEIAQTRGDLSAENLLAKLAIQFGRATARGNALRDVLGDVDPETGRWKSAKPDPGAMESEMEEHRRGALLVAALFDTFVTIYKARIADLMRIASSGTGVLPAGALHPDLVNRLAAEASKAAQHILTMCIRALDYCPPVDLTFGEYLRALITADYDLVRDDERGYRIALIEAFRRRGIYPRDVRSMSVESLRWQPPTTEMLDVLDRILPDVHALRSMIQEWDRPLNEVEEKALLDRMLKAKGGPVDRKPEEVGDWGRTTRHSSDREAIYRRMLNQARLLGGFIKGAKTRHTIKNGALIGMDLGGNSPVEVHSVRPATRVRPDGRTFFDLVVVITQTSREKSSGRNGNSALPFRGGCTLLIDPETRQIRYCIVKNVLSKSRRARFESFARSFTDHSALTREFHREGDGDAEPFAMIHRCEEQEEHWV
jgi:hypothetical protein